MDPLTQSLLGAVTAHAFMARRLGRVALLLGAVGGELADADVLLTPWCDPALPFELHRHFTHALAFIPVGGLLAAAPFMLFRRARARAGSVVAATTIGYATHGLLDNCTSYGTHLLWPFHAARTAWDCISIIDPVFTVALLLGVIVSLCLRGPRPARAALALGLLYLGVGLAQHARVADVQSRLAEGRGHEIERGRVMPTLGNVILWRSVYEHDGRLYADAVRVPIGRPPLVRPGTSVPRFTAGDIPARISDPARVRAVFEAFSAFATGFTARVGAPGDSAIAVGDVRYSFDAAGFAPIWGLRIDPHDALAPVRAINFDAGAGPFLRRLWQDVIDPGAVYVPVEAAVRIPSPARSASPSRAPARS